MIAIIKKQILETLEDKVLFTKYPEIINGKDLGEIHRFHFQEGNYSDQTIIAETMRGLALAIATGTTFAYPIQAPIEQIKFWENMIGKKANLLIYDNSNSKGYTKLMNSLTPSSLHVMHPYDMFNDNIYNTNPKILEFLNGKENLHFLTENTPQRKVIKTTNLNEEVNGFKEGYVLKKIHGSSSGDGVRIIKNEDINFLDEFLKDTTEIILEEFINPIENYGMQFFIDKNSEVHYLGFNKQYTTKEGEFEAVSIIYSEEPDKEMYNIALAAAKNVASHNYEGWLGFDILKSSEDKYYIIDANIRMTAATSAIMLKEILQPLLGNYVYLGVNEAYAENPSEIIQIISDLGGVPLCISNESYGKYKYYAMYGGNTFTDAEKSWKTHLTSIC